MLVFDVDHACVGIADRPGGTELIVELESAERIQESDELLGMLGGAHAITTDGHTCEVDGGLGGGPGTKDPIGGDAS